MEEYELTNEQIIEVSRLITKTINKINPLNILEMFSQIEIAKKNIEELTSVLIKGVNSDTDYYERTRVCISRLEEIN